MAGVSPPPSLCPSHREAVLPKLHLDEDYPCSLVGNWNTWYGEQDQAGEVPTPPAPLSPAQAPSTCHTWLPTTPFLQQQSMGSF